MVEPSYLYRMGHTGSQLKSKGGLYIYIYTYFFFWLVVTGTMEFHDFPIILGMSWSQLANSYFQRGWAQPPTSFSLDPSPSFWISHLLVWAVNLLTKISHFSLGWTSIYKPTIYPIDAPVIMLESGIHISCYCPCYYAVIYPIYTQYIPNIYPIYVMYCYDFVMVVFPYDGLSIIWRLIGGNFGQRSRI